MSVGTCGDCGDVFVAQDGHRCAPTTGDRLMDAIGSFVDTAKRVAELERQVADLKAENERLRAGHA